ncbi:HAMP domain-containing sensor histidine kinase [Persephonella sp.]
MKTKSIRNKIITAFLVASLIPFTASFFLVFKQGKEHLKENIINQQFSHLQFLEKAVINDFYNLHTELTFWANNQLLNDILVEDIDKRIQKFITSIKNKRIINGEIIVTDKNGKIISSTVSSLTGKKLSLKYLNSFFTDIHRIKVLKKPVMKLTVPIVSQINTEKIGYFTVFLYPEYFSKYTFKSPENTGSLYNKKENIFVGEEIPIPKIMQSRGYFEYLNYITVYTRIDDFYLNNWYILVQFDRDSVFQPIESMESTFTGIALLGIGIILLFSILVANNLVKPIEMLTETANYISRTKDYSKRVKIQSEDELGILALAFNNMLSEIQKALEKIRAENTERLKLFTKLIEIINKISSAKTEKEVIRIATTELEKFLNINRVQFVEKSPEKGINIPVSTETVKGFIHFDIGRKPTPEEEQFFKSVGRMVNLYIEKLELLNKAQEASKAKSSFISNISHELRTPLNSIIGFAQYLQMSETDEQNIQAARSIETAGKHLLDMINEILDFAKTEAGAVKVNKTKFQLDSLLKEVYSIIQPLVKEKNLQLIFPKNTGLKLNTDYRLLKQVLLNLLSNAVKFTEKGYIRLQVNKENGKVVFSVSDTGIGISKENLNKLFSEFSQLENPLQKKYRGTGLGLAISKRYVELLGGEISAYSEGEGKGATFTFYIPLS